MNLAQASAGPPCTNKERERLDGDKGPTDGPT